MAYLKLAVCFLNSFCMAAKRYEKSKTDRQTHLIYKNKHCACEGMFSQGPDKESRNLKTEKPIHEPTPSKGATVHPSEAGYLFGSSEDFCNILRDNVSE